MKLNVVNLPGKCSEAFRFYEKHLEAERIFSALSEAGEVFIPIQETFFATRFAQLRDRFGINWMILHERPTPPRSDG